MESPQSPHSSSLWVFALSLFESYLLSSSAPISHLGTKLFFYGFSVFGLRVISQKNAFVECLVIENIAEDRILALQEQKVGLVYRVCILIYCKNLCPEEPC